MKERWVFGEKSLIGTTFSPSVWIKTVRLKNEQPIFIYYSTFTNILSMFISLLKHLPISKWAYRGLVVKATVRWF